MSSSFSELNRAHFDTIAQSYDAKIGAQEVIDRVVEHLQADPEWLGVDWIKEHEYDVEKDEEGEEIEVPRRDVRVLDYACGTGLVSKVRGIDISPAMVAAYNTHASNQGLSPQEMHATAGDFLSSTPSPSLLGPDFYSFDLAVVGLGFHHFDDPELAARRLSERLKPKTGVLLVIDFLPHGKFEAQDGSHNTVAHHGFSRERIVEIFERAGCVDVRVEVLGKGISIGDQGGKQERSVFMARGRRDE
ncbi:MAG: hypothetical protein M1819_004185 [Sarea resinae]|nr:MAG: hypothetical protein M1819_004185 [Sarea resinae]